MKSWEAVQLRFRQQCIQFQSLRMHIFSTKRRARWFETPSFLFCFENVTLKRYIIVVVQYNTHNHVDQKWTWILNKYWDNTKRWIMWHWCIEWMNVRTHPFKKKKKFHCSMVYNVWLIIFWKSVNIIIVNGEIRKYRNTTFVFFFRKIKTVTRVTSQSYMEEAS